MGAPSREGAIYPARASQWGITTARNVLAFLNYRSFWYVAGGRQSRDVQNLRYDHRRTGGGLSITNQLPVFFDILDGFTIIPPGTEPHYGYCSESGRYCTASGSGFTFCGGAEPTCIPDRHPILSGNRLNQGHEGHGPIGGIYLSGNKVEKPDGNLQADVGFPEFDNEWDRMNNVSYRPHRNHVLGDPAKGPNTFWGQRRGVEQRYRLVLEPADAADLEAPLLAYAGPVHCDPITQEILEEIAERGDGAGLAEYVTYPVYSTLPDWTDTDEDGLPDWFEDAHCGGSCAPDDYCHYPWRCWQRFVHRDAFGDEVEQVTPDEP